MSELFGARAVKSEPSRAHLSAPARELPPHVGRSVKWTRANDSSLTAETMNLGTFSVNETTEWRLVLTVYLYS